MKLWKKLKEKREAERFAEMEAQTVGAQLGRFREACDRVGSRSVSALVEAGAVLDGEARKAFGYGPDYRLGGGKSVFGIDHVSGSLYYDPEVVCEHDVVCFEADSGVEVQRYGPLSIRGRADEIWRALVVFVRKTAFLRHPIDAPLDYGWRVEWTENGELKRFAVYVPRRQNGDPLNPWEEADAAGYPDLAAGKFAERCGGLLPSAGLVSPWVSSPNRL